MAVLSHQIALKIFQESLLILSEWSQAGIVYNPIDIEVIGKQAITEAKQLVKWPTDKNCHDAINPLKVVFDAVHLDKGQDTVHYWPAWAIKNTENPRDPRKHYPQIPYPMTREPDEAQISALKDEAKADLAALTSDDWGQLSLLMLMLEKYGTYISFGEPDIAFFDQAKTTAAIAAVLGGNPEAEQLCLVAGDLSGIQDFIYTISSDGALKSLRARSFTLELVTEEIVQQLLTRLELPRSNVIYSGGGNLYLLTPASEDVQQKVSEIREDFNKWLLTEFQGKVFLSLTSCAFLKSDVSKQEFTDHWEAAIQKLAIQKSRKFDNQIVNLLATRHAHEPCKVCHRDDRRTLKPLGGDGVEACPTCNQMFSLGQKLFKVGALVRSPSAEKGALARIKIKLGEEEIYYHLFESAKSITKDPEAVYLINNWDLDLYKFAHFENPTPLLLGNYGQESGEEAGTFMTAGEMAENESKGIKRVGYLRMDVDKLGRIFAQGLGNKYTLSRLSGLSRQMSYFFKVYLNSLAEYRQRDFIAHSKHQPFQHLTNRERQDLLFIYAGGDDLFVSGAWDQVVEFAFDVYQSFRAFTGWHPDITLSAGISLSGPKYPLYQSADDSGNAEGVAKANGRDSLSLFEQVFKWKEWLGTANTDTLKQDVQEYLEKEIQPDWFGIFPFVDYLQELLGTQYSRSFTRNLLSTAQLQEQWVKQLKREKEKAEKNQLSTKALPIEKDLRYFLHLPRVAYTLARFPVAVKNAKGFDTVRRSLKSPYNAPYFRAIATWLELLNRSTSGSKTTNE